MDVHTLGNLFFFKLCNNRIFNPFPFYHTQSAPDFFFFLILLFLNSRVWNSFSLVYYRITCPCPMDRACWTAIRYVSILTLYCNKRIKVLWKSCSSYFFIGRRESLFGNMLSKVRCSCDCRYIAFGTQISCFFRNAELIPTAMRNEKNIPLGRRLPWGSARRVASLPFDGRGAAVRCDSSSAG